MAFMMPVVKNDYNLYASCPSTKSGTPQQSRGHSLSTSPAGASFLSSPRHSHTPAYTRTAKSDISLQKFHSKVLDKLKRAFRTKDTSGSTEDVTRASRSSIEIR
ncbi:uncharacterized protein [Parasteatoda tepidariorum]|uniref:uncharacterized protein n=1 Tax=Parasteatoda tepidariorum TaxID=114398 RepID=UPI00077FE148|nr:uncharacterized protein LOC107449542 [Parasteatoda tepidariorum]